MDATSTAASGSKKRKVKASPETTEGKGPNSGGKAKKSKASEETQLEADADWPEYFQSLFKVFKALNTVLAFIASRQHLATTFPVVRSSVESLLKHPLELSKVAEIKALLPEHIKFAYIRQAQLQINGNAPRSRREGSPDFSAIAPGLADSSAEEDHVLVLEFVGRHKGKGSKNQSTSYAMPPSLNPAEMKKLVDKRNELFRQAVNELLWTFPSVEEIINLLQSSGRNHIPIKPLPEPAMFSVSSQESMIVPEPKDRPSINEVLTEISSQGWYRQQIQYRRTFEAKVEQIVDDIPAELDSPLSASILQALKISRNISVLYTHQVAAINAVEKGKHVIVSTSTASGKSIIYQVPLLKFLEENHAATAIFVYPTKALAQDQRGALEQLLGNCPGLEHIKVATYDGDTPQPLRKGIRETASVIFTNFDMIHASILPHEDQWRRFLKNLKLVAVDELHYYSGLFGSNVAQVIRRFRRVCAAVGNRRALFVSCSATISNPGQHMKNIFGVDGVEVITEDGAPSGRKDFIIWNSQPVKNKPPTNSLAESTGLMRYLMKRGIRVILFCKIRKMCEMAMKLVRTDLSLEGRSDIMNRVMSYRGGYSPEDRRRIEHEAFSGHLLGIVATNALELGVDIGVLDAVIMLGFPMSIASLRQQSGRAGRRARDSLAVLVPDNLLTDVFHSKDADDLFDKPVEDLVIDLDSKVILEAHLQCAGQEMPLCADDEVYFGPLTVELCEKRLRKDKDGWYHTHPNYLPQPSRHVSIRGREEEKYLAIDVAHGGTSSKVLEEVEVSRSMFELYEGGVFIHQGETFIVKEVNHDSKTAKLMRASVNWITRPRELTDTDPVQTDRIRSIKGSPHLVYYGRVEIMTKVFGFLKIRGDDIIDVVDLETPPWERESNGLWIDVPKVILDLMKSKAILPAEAIHSAEHAFLNRFALAPDLRTDCKAAEKEYNPKESRRKRPARLIFYDAVGKTGGVAAKAFDNVREILHNAYRTVEACDCVSGCRKCIFSPSCIEGNTVNSKIGAKILLQFILGLEIDVDGIPMQDFIGAHDTVVEASRVRQADGVQIERDE